MNNIHKESSRLLRDVDAFVVPSGDEVKLLAGNLVQITQALGGNYTVLINGNMVQITSENADALGLEIQEETLVNSGGNLEQQVWDQLKTCYDPEIPVNIVELGLIYDLNIKESDTGQKINIKMTLTAPGCGMGPVIAQDVEDKLMDLATVNRVIVDLVWEPVWNQAMMTDAARLELGML